MEPRWAAENLQVIRTLMERATLYRRALAPVMTVTGSIGLVAAGIGQGLGVVSPEGFVTYWMGVALLALVAAFLLVRRQAFLADEPYWTPPTRRVAQALAPAFCAGGCAGLLVLMWGRAEAAWPGFLVPLWLACYGVGLHAAGFFMVRGMRWFGWIMLTLGLLYAVATLSEAVPLPPHGMMGAGFGAAQLAYGVYLYFTERKEALW